MKSLVKSYHTMKKNNSKSQAQLNYGLIKEKALIHSHALLKTWLPNGVIKLHEYIALNPTRNDQHLGSFRINIRSGQWADFATNDRGGDLISLLAYLNCSSNKQAAQKLSTLFGLEEK